MSRLGRERLFGRWRVETVGSYISVQLQSCLRFCEHFSWPCFSLWQRCLGLPLLPSHSSRSGLQTGVHSLLKCFHQGSMDLMIWETWEQWYFQDRQHGLFTQILKSNTGFWQVVSQAEVENTNHEDGIFCAFFFFFTNNELDYARMQTAKIHTVGILTGTLRAQRWQSSGG